MFRLIFYHHLFLPYDLEENTEPVWRGKGLVVIVVVAWCGELKISEANVLGRIQFLLELLLLLDKTALEAHKSLLNLETRSFRIRFGGRVWGSLCGKLLDKAIFLYISVFIFQSSVSSLASSYPCLSVLSLFDAKNLCLPLCFSVDARHLTIESQIQ